MTDASHSVSSQRERLLRRAALVTIFGLGTIAYRALLDYDPSSANRTLSGGDAVFFSPSGNAPFFVYSVSAWIFFHRRARFFSALGLPAPLAPGVALVAGAVLVCAWAYYVQAPDLLAASLSLACLGASWWLGGREVLRVALLPALVLLALIPIPAVLINEAVHRLQLATSTISVGLLKAAGLEAVQAADLFAVGERVFQVIESCSGIRSSQTLLLSAILYQEIFYRSRRQSVLLVVLAPLLGFFVNQIRVITLVFNPYSGQATVHSAQGVVMLVVGILLITALDKLLSHWMSAEPQEPIRQASGPVALPRLAITAAASGLLAAASFTPSSASTEQGLAWNPHDIPLNLSGWRSEPLQLDRQFLGSATFDKDANRRFRLGDDSIDVFAGVARRGRRVSSLITPKTLTLGTGRMPSAQEAFPLGPGAPAATAATIRSHEGLQRVVRWHTNVDTLGRETLRALLALDRGTTRRPGMPHVIRLSTPIAEPGKLQAADTRLRDFARDLLAAIERLKKRTREQRAQGEAATEQER